MIELIQAELVFGTLTMFTVTFIFEIYLSQNIITSEYEETTYMSVRRESSFAQDRLSQFERFKTPRSYLIVHMDEA